MNLRLALLLAWMPSVVFCQSNDPSIMLLKQKRGANAGSVADFHRSYGVSPIYLKHVGWSIVRIPIGQERRLNDEYRKSGLFEKCESNRIYRACIIPNDPLYPQLWGMQKIKADRGWDVTTSNSVIVAVIDTGVDFSHPDLAGNLWIGPSGEHGYTAIGGILTVGGKDDHFHGTHVAGTIGAVGNNGIGVAGIAWNTLILSLKFLNSQGWGYTADAVICIDKMIDLKLLGHNIRISNNSWGGAVLDIVLEDAFRAAEEAGILSVCAAGNDSQNTDIEPFSPATLPVDSIISVVASDQNDEKALFSNYGTATTDLLAPGVGIVSLDTNGGYRTLNGTSMASPHVAGVAAAIIGLNASLAPFQVKGILLNPDSFDQTAFLQTTTSGGRLNMGKALSNGLIYAPTNNRSPSISVSGPLTLRPGESGTISASGNDPDGDALRYTVLLHAIGETLGQEFNTVFLPTNRITVTNFARAIAITLEAVFGVSDGKGGAATARSQIFMEENPAFVHPVTASLSLSPTTYHPFWELFVESPSSGFYSLFFSSYQYIDGANCCYVANTATPLYRGLQSGPNLFRAYLWDEDGNFANSQRLVVNDGPYVPEARVSVNRVRGGTPLFVTADLSASDPDGTHSLTYISRLWNRYSGAQISPPFSDARNPVQTFTITNVGVTAVEFVVNDPVTAVSDKVVQLFTVYPIGPRMTISRSGQSITLNWTEAKTTDVLEVTPDLRTWSAFRTGLPPITVQVQSGMKAFRVQAYGH